MSLGLWAVLLLAIVFSMLRNGSNRTLAWFKVGTLAGGGLDCDESNWKHHQRVARNRTKSHSRNSYSRCHTSVPA